eukprot:jgi/Chlat1/8187/Chrsp76S07660
MSSRFPSFPAAAQPDVLRASQKDDLYQAFLYDACYGAVREVLGKVKLIANLVYYGLTTGFGLQTLGEEYCDIQQELCTLSIALQHAGSQLGHTAAACKRPLEGCAYYHVSKRLTGIRYIFTGKLLETRPSYQILGMSVMGLLWARQHVLPAVAQPLGFSQPQPTGKGVLVLDSDGQPLEEDESIDSKEGEKDASEHRKCTLCLSIRQSTTATPCGHLFCWYCIAEWCNTKPECPLCRAPITQSALIRVYHTDL